MQDQHLSFSALVPAITNNIIFAELESHCFRTIKNTGQDLPVPSGRRTKQFKSLLRSFLFGDSGKKFEFCPDIGYGKTLA
jgi:hypothetical protein